MFEINVGTADRAIRIVVGLALITLVFVRPETMWGWVGVLPFTTGLMRTCPLYTLLGVRTCKS